MEGSPFVERSKSFSFSDRTPVSGAASFEDSPLGTAIGAEPSSNSSVISAFTEETEVCDDVTLDPDRARHRRPSIQQHQQPWAGFEPTISDHQVERATTAPPCHTRVATSKALYTSFWASFPQFCVLCQTKIAQSNLTIQPPPTRGKCVSLCPPPPLCPPPLPRPVRPFFSPSFVTVFLGFFIRDETFWSSPWGTRTGQWKYTLLSPSHPLPHISLWGGYD